MEADLRDVQGNNWRKIDCTGLKNGHNLVSEAKRRFGSLRQRFKTGKLHTKNLMTFLVLWQRYRTGEGGVAIDEDGRESKHMDISVHKEKKW